MKDFFSIISRGTDESGRHVYTLSVNAEHDIFNGHFPNRPIVPGVMTLFMARRCAEDAANLGNTRLAAVKDAKYIAPIIPDGRNVTIAFTIDDDLSLKADVTDPDGNFYTKIKASLVKA